jgi:hypothetical protein
MNPPKITGQTAKAQPYIFYLSGDIFSFDTMDRID